MLAKILALLDQSNILLSNPFQNHLNNLDQRGINKFNEDRSSDLFNNNKIDENCDENQAINSNLFASHNIKIPKTTQKATHNLNNTELVPLLKWAKNIINPQKIHITNSSIRAVSHLHENENIFVLPSYLVISDQNQDTAKFCNKIKNKKYCIF